MKSREAVLAAAQALRTYAARQDAKEETPIDLLWKADPPFLQTVATPLWQQLAHDLNNGRYLETRAVLEQLAEKKAFAEKFVYLWTNTTRYAGHLLQQLHHQAADHGLDEPIGAQVFSIPPESRSALGLPELDEDYADPDRTLSYTFKAEDTFRTALASVERRIARYRSLADSRGGVLAVQRFREHLLLSALFQYETYGAVDPDVLPTSETSEPDLPDTSHALVHLGVLSADRQAFCQEAERLTGTLDCSLEAAWHQLVDRLQRHNLAAPFDEYDNFRKTFYDKGYAVLNSRARKRRSHDL